MLMLIATYTPLEQNFLRDLGISVPSFSAGEAVSFSSVTIFMVILSFMLIGGAAFSRFLMAGIYRLEASESGIRKSNEAVQHGFLGPLGVFLMFIIFFTFNRDFLLSNPSFAVFGSDPVRKKEVSAPISQTPPPTGSCVRRASALGRTCTEADFPRVSGSNDSVVRSNLSPVTVNNNPCTYIGQKNCTNVGGMSDSLVSMIKNLQTTCKCSVIVTGGTEWWSHSTHGPGANTVDLRIRTEEDDLYKFLLREGKKVGGPTSYCGITLEWNGWRFCDERGNAFSRTTSRHWHVSQ